MEQGLFHFVHSIVSKLTIQMSLSRQLIRGLELLVLPKIEDKLKKMDEKTVQSQENAEKCVTSQLFSTNFLHFYGHRSEILFSNELPCEPSLISNCKTVFEFKNRLYSFKTR